MEFRGDCHADEEVDVGVPLWLWILAVVVVVTVLICGYCFIDALSGDGRPLGDRGTFGDMFGGINALFSGLAFASLIYTMFLQRDELRAQRKELKDTRATLDEQRLQMEMQSRVFAKQAFEDTFFRMLAMLHDVTEKTSILSHGSMIHAETEGDKGFEILRDEIRTDYQFLSQNSPEGVDERTLVYGSVPTSFSGRDIELGRYFDLLLSMAAFILEHDDINRRMYASLIRTQTTNNQLFCIVYYCVGMESARRLKLNLKAIGFFEEIPAGFLIDPSHEKLLSYTRHSPAAH